MEKIKTVAFISLVIYDTLILTGFCVNLITGNL